jgi:hypothetical protein
MSQRWWHAQGGDTVAFLDHDGKSLYRPHGEYFAYIDHGYIYDLTANVIGYFADNGRDVYDLSGNYLGYFHP